VRPWCQPLEAEARATVRFETPPGRQLQIDFGTTTVRIGEEPVVVRLFVATLGYSRRAFVAAFDHEQQAAWLEGLERTFRILAGCRRRCWWTMPGPWWTTTTGPRGWWCSTPGFWPLSGMGGSNPGVRALSSPDQGVCFILHLYRTVEQK